MKRLLYNILFLGLNFGALTLGVWLMNSGPVSDWYKLLNKAPWTPPGWMFGVAWSFIMICYSIYMSQLVLLKSNFNIWILFVLQWMLNVSWNYVFFNQHLIMVGLINLFLLFSLITFFMIKFNVVMKKYSFFIFPYFLWLLVAISLNGYVLLFN
ncbi:TspO/MBR family protein [Bacteroidota bacterium]